VRFTGCGSAGVKSTLDSTASESNTLGRYRDLMRRYAAIAGKANPGSFLAPSTRMGIRARNWIFRYSILLRTMVKLGDTSATGVELPYYGIRGAESGERSERRMGPARPISRSRHREGGRGPGAPPSALAGRLAVGQAKARPS
jgi:hypothetical protein